MRLFPSEPDIATIVQRIKHGDMDLQPAFQRGQVWGLYKKQRLIDSILREWHIPPIHVIEDAGSRSQEVLDGQQRLVAIRDFAENKFPIHGLFEPIDSDLAGLDGLLFENLPKEYQRRFNQFTIRVIRITDFDPQEPAELFFRLNQPSSLTGAEQRNAFFGTVRSHVKDLVRQLENESIPPFILAFSNSRMAFDDVLARTVLTVDRRSIEDKITANDLADMYRLDQPLGEETVSLVKYCIEQIGRASRIYQGPPPKLNKATLYSWLIFSARSVLNGITIDPRELAHFWFDFHSARHAFRQGSDSNWTPLLRVYEDRSSSRVADVSSVLLRDAITWLICDSTSISLRTPKREMLVDTLTGLPTFDDEQFARMLLINGWGRLA